MNRKKFLTRMAVVILMLSTGCSGKITIEITTPPPASLEVNQSSSITATLAHDSSSDSVNWSCTPVGSCGTFTPANTESGAATVYMAPDTAGPVVITAASKKEPKKTATANVTINPVANTSDISGTYTFFANGTDASLGAYSVAGNIAINGATGMITTGEQDYFDVTSGDVFKADAITMGTINVGADGRGTLSLTPTAAPAETFSITVVNDKHILITQFNTAATASGSLDLQTAPATIPTGGNAFALLDAGNDNAIGGVLTSNGATATASEADDDLAGLQDFDFAIAATFTAPDLNGRGTVTLTDPNLAIPGFETSIELAYYVVGPEVFRLIEIDAETTPPGFFPQYEAGSMYGQGAAPFAANTVGPKLVFGQSGVEGIAFGAFAAAGQFTLNGTNSLSAGVADVNEGDGNAVKAGSLTGSSYFINADGYAGITILGAGATTDGLTNFGIYLTDPAINVADPNSSSGGGGAVMLDLDTDNIGIGIVVPQATSPTFTGNFAFSQDGVFQTATAFAWYGLLGQVNSNGTSKFSGLGDYNELGIAQNPAVTVSGTYTADASNTGRSTSTLTVNGAATPNNITIYQASSSLLLHVDTDTTTNGVEDFGTIGLGVFEQQQ
jgi:hypothetical protein